MEHALAFAIHLAQQAGDLLLDFHHSNRLEIELKADGSVLTEADLAADHLISSEIKKHYSEDLLMSEEHPTAFSQDELEANRYIWVVDPLDGSTNFSLGFPIWGVMLTRLKSGWPEVAVTYFPLLNETYSSQLGLGAFLNGLPLQIDEMNSKRRPSFFACCSRTYQNYQVSIPYKTRIMGSAGYSMCAVAKNTAILAFESTPKIWDIAAGWLIVNEAGGVIETLDYSHPFPLQPGFSYSQKNFPTVAAANQSIIKFARERIIPRNR